MNEEILKLAASVGLYPYYPEQAGDIECFYRAAYNAGLEAAAKCYSPDDSANDWMDKIRALEKK